MSDEWDTEYFEEEEQQPSDLDDVNDTSLQDILTALFAMQNGDTTGAQRVRLSGVTMQDLSRLFAQTSELRSRGITLRMMDEDDDNDNDNDNGDDEDDDYEGQYSSGRYPRWFTPVKEPQEAGVSLILNGDFGHVAPKSRARAGNLNMARRLLSRTSKPHSSLSKEDITTNLVPNHNGITVAEYEANIYTGQFSADSSFYYTCSQDFRLHVFDTTSSPNVSDSTSRSRYTRMGLKSRMKIMKTIEGHPGRWTITDANLSPDNQRLIYSSIAPTVYMATTLDGNDVQTPIPFADPPSRRNRDWGSESFGIWSCRFSADGNEVIAGGKGHIFVYDLLANRRSVRIRAHEADVNSCCWADTASGNVLVSASDDTYLKVWDRRSLGDSQRPSGVLIGHTEGITYVSAKGDGRYVISNGKDQALRLWDLRKMRSHAEYQSVKHENYGVPDFDYRYPDYPRPRHKAHPDDCSVMTYRGHAVMQTLIRCHFSPAETTGAQYLYSGSSDGKVHIWSLDGRVVQVLDRSQTVPYGHDPEGYTPTLRQRRRAEGCVRDVSWHSQEPVLLSAAWESANGGSTVARHEWKGLSKFRGNLDDWNERQQTEQAELDKLTSWHHSRRSSDLSEDED